MISNPELEFTVNDFIKSLQGLDRKAAQKEVRVAYSEAVSNKRFTQANLGMFKDNSDGSIWKLETAEDGKQYIVRTNLEDTIKVGSWTIHLNRTSEHVTVAYKNTAIQRFAAVEYGFSPTTASAFAETLADRIRSNEKQFASGLATTLPQERRAALQAAYGIFC